MKRYFGTDGIRGKANRDLTPELAMRLGRAVVKALVSENPHPKIIVGRDTRISGDMLQAALVSGICAEGADAIVMDIMPTAGIAYLTEALGADAGAVISASHNPFTDNGIKILGRSGMKLSDHTESAIEGALEEMKVGTGQITGVVKREKEARESYVEHLLGTSGGGLEGMKVALDCAQGAAYQIAPMVFERLGAKVEAIGVAPDGTNINEACGSNHPGSIQEFTKKVDAEVGFSFDGDADRCICVDETGQIRDGDYVMAALAHHMMEKGDLEPPLVVCTVMSNLGLISALGSLGIETVRTKVGDRYVLEEMLKRGARLGGEQSGHIIIRQYATTGDGILTAVQVASLMRDSKKNLLELCDVMTKLPQVLVNVEAKKGKRLTEESAVWKRVGELEDQLAGDGRILVRSSGTEPVERVMVEAGSEERAMDIANEIVEMISREINR